MKIGLDENRSKKIGLFEDRYRCS